MKIKTIMKMLLTILIITTIILGTIVYVILIGWFIAMLLTIILGCIWYVFPFLIKWFIGMLLIIIISMFITYILWLVFPDLRKRFIARKMGYEIGRFRKDVEYFVEGLRRVNGDLPKRVSCDSDSLVLNRYEHVSKGLEKTFFFLLGRLVLMRIKVL